MKTFLLGAFISMLPSFGLMAKVDCPSLKLPAGWTHEQVTVPFDWEDPSNPETIKVSYYYKNQDLYKGKTPIIFFNGGPAVAGNSAITALPTKAPALNDENMIFMDQRGTGCSTNFVNYSADSDLAVYKRYASASIVKDAEVIRKKLFNNEKWKIYGQSYGGLISFRYLELFPESIASAHIHGFGFSSEPLLELREKRIKELTPELLKYRNKNTTLLTIGEIVERIKNVDNDKKEMFKSICVDTPGSLKGKFCGEDVFSGLFFITGFRDFWNLAHHRLFNIMTLLEKDDKERLQEYYAKFASTYLLRFNDINQAAALHSISYNEMFLERLLYDGCAIENELISECRFHKNFLMRLKQRPDFKATPINLDTVRDNIKKHTIGIRYYAGVYDSFLPLQTLQYTAKYLEIESSFHIFPKSGHEGYISEILVIENLIAD